jgi:hypothetical protein
MGISSFFSSAVKGQIVKLRGRRLAEGRIAHPETCPNMLGKEFDGAAVGDGVRLGQILHGLYQQALSIHIAWIGGALTALSSNIRGNRDGKNLGHAIQMSNADLESFLSSIPPR